MLKGALEAAEPFLSMPSSVLLSLSRSLLWRYQGLTAWEPTTGIAQHDYIPAGVQGPFRPFASIRGSPSTCMTGNAASLAEAWRGRPTW
eukprot:scaffold1070_cov245-Pinguiococcus_pyrenoidosus.AAC.17